MFKLWSFGGCLLLVCALARSSAASEPHATTLPPGWSWPPSPQMEQAGERCLQRLTALGVGFRHVERRWRTIVTPVVVPSQRFGAIEVKSVRTPLPSVMDCELALVLTEHSHGLAALGVKTLLLGRVYHPRAARLGGRSVGLRSRHSFALAADIRGFVTQKGQRFTVLGDYDRPFVRRVEEQLLRSDGFRAVVTPGNDRWHRDHFHLSAKMTIDPAHPDRRVEVHELLRAARATGTGRARRSANL